MAQEIDDFLRKDETRNTQYHNNRHTELQTKNIPLAQSAEILRTIIESAERLIALPDAEHRTKHKVDDTHHDGHTRNGSVTKGTSSHIQHHCCHTCQTLASERRRTTTKHLIGNPPLRTPFIEFHVAPTNRNVISPTRHHQQHHKCHNLTRHRTNGSTQNPHVEHKHEERNQQHIQCSTRHHAVHGLIGVPLKAHLIVERHRCCQERSTQQDTSQVPLRVGQNRWSGTQSQR